MSGRDEGFRSFYDEQYPSLRAIAYRLTGSWAAADDLAQEAMMRTYRAWRRIRERERPEVYARAVLVNRHRSAVRRRILETKHRADPPPAWSPGASDDRTLVWSELARLPVRERQAVVLHFYEDLPQTEVARIMGCPSGTVNSLVFRGLQRLRAGLGEEDEAVRSPR